jgi:hypothetical protein
MPLRPKRSADRSRRALPRAPHRRDRIVGQDGTDALSAAVARLYEAINAERVAVAKGVRHRAPFARPRQVTVDRAHDYVLTTAGTYLCRAGGDTIQWWDASIAFAKLFFFFPKTKPWAGSLGGSVSFTMECPLARTSPAMMEVR